MIKKKVWYDMIRYIYMRSKADKKASLAQCLAQKQKTKEKLKKTDQLRKNGAGKSLWRQSRCGMWLACTNK